MAGKSKELHSYSNIMNNSPQQQSPTWLTPIFPQQNLFTYSKHSLFGRKKLVKHLLGSDYCFTSLQRNIHGHERVHERVHEKQSSGGPIMWIETVATNTNVPAPDLWPPQLNKLESPQRWFIQWHPCVSPTLYRVSVVIWTIFWMLSCSLDQTGPDWTRLRGVSRISKPSQVFLT